MLGGRLRAAAFGSQAQSLGFESIILFMLSLFALFCAHDSGNKPFFG
jgi:hypothetical protein